MELSPSDHEEIRQLFARYTQAADQRDVKAVTDCFTDEAVFFFGAADEAPAEMTFVGHERIGELIQGGSAEPDVVMQHWVSGAIKIDATDGGATAQAYCQILRIPAGKTPAIAMTGTYRDELTRIGDGWRVSRREFVPNP